MKADRRRAGRSIRRARQRTRRTIANLNQIANGCIDAKRMIGTMGIAFTARLRSQRQPET